MTLEFENHKVKVTRVSVSGPGPGSAPDAKRGDRLIIHLRDSQVKRHQGSDHEILRRKAGEVVWRDASEHHVEVLHAGDHEVLIIEFKQIPRGWSREPRSAMTDAVSKIKVPEQA